PGRGAARAGVSAAQGSEGAGGRGAEVGAPVAALRSLRGGRAAHGRPVPRGAQEAHLPQPGLDLAGDPDRRPRRGHLASRAQAERLGSLAAAVKAPPQEAARPRSRRVGPLLRPAAFEADLARRHWRLTTPAKSNRLTSAPTSGKPS